MNLQRYQAYQNLIEMLLSCSSPEQCSTIINNNKDLLDTELLDLIKQTVKNLSQKGDQDSAIKATFLTNFASLLAEELGLSQPTNPLTFLSLLFRKIETSNGDWQVVFPLLEANQEKLNDDFAEWLDYYATVMFSQEKPEKVQYVAGLICQFCDLIKGFPSVNQPNKVDIIIKGYEISAKFITYESYPEDWATIQNSLGLAYLDKQVWGKTGENLETAIHCFENSLKFYTYQTDRIKWAFIRSNLGLAYLNRIQDNEAKNLEKAIRCFKGALSIPIRENHPKTWANIKINLAIAYTNRIRGEKASNLKNAIRYYHDALEEFTYDNHPTQWAIVQANLGVVYGNRTLGEIAVNLETAIECFDKALKVYTKQNYPEIWADTSQNLGHAYLRRIRKEKKKNLELAIQHISDALEVYTSQNLLTKRAGALVNLGVAYRERIQGQEAENLEIAIDRFKDALKVYTKQDFPSNWANTQNNLGNAYYLRSRGSKQEDLKAAIDCFKNALKVYTKQDFPFDWANTQNNLGNAYRIRIDGEKLKNLEQAIEAYKLALQIITREAFPQNYIQTLANLGFVYQDAQNFHKAYDSFFEAINTIESQRSEILLGSGIEEDKKKLAEEWNILYQSMVQICLELGKNNEAIEYVERSKTRNLVELILDRDFKTIFPLEVVNQLEELRDKIASGQYEIQNGTAKDLKSLAQNLQQLRQKRQELQDRYLPVGSSFRFEQFQPTLDQRTAIIEWYITNEKIIAFAVKPNGQELTVWQSQPEDREALVNWVNEYLQDYYRIGKNQWRDKLDERLKQLSKILHLELILNQIPDQEQYDRLILIPHRFLHLLPLHALSVGESYLLDRFSQGVGYAPSCQLLQQVQQRERPYFQSLFAVQNPTGDLEFTDQEVNSILSLFPSHKVLSNSHATKAAIDQAARYLKDVDYLHFSCHGSFNPDSPFLLLANAEVSSIPADANPKQYLKTSKGFIDLSKCLTLDNLFKQGFDLNKCRLVVLSACETGLIDFNNNSDEYIGLPSGFLYAGSTCVVSSLWTVNDQSTAYLMIKFLQNLKKSEDISVAVALNKAQNWLRNITWEDLENWANNLQLDSRNNREIERSIRQMREIVAKNARSKNIDEKPFQSPYHWAAFTAIGK
ncbi:MAG: CHAT domain-containing protein [Nostoc sp. ZfuVER08]|nr:CHAT domain-containing protein [Nostoc sp. ZfuVER08]